MSMTDPIADLLTRIRNGLRAKHKNVELPSSRIKLEIVRILKDEGYIDDFSLLEQAPQPVIRIALKYQRDGRAAIHGISRVSRPGRRVYCGKHELPKVLGGLGVSILSTPSGVMTSSACGRSGVGGEVLCSIW